MLSTTPTQQPKMQNGFDEKTEFTKTKQLATAQLESAKKHLVNKNFAAGIKACEEVLQITAKNPYEDKYFIDEFVQGNVAAIVGYNYIGKEIKSKATAAFDFEVAPLPQIDLRNPKNILNKSKIFFSEKYRRHLPAGMER